MNEQQFYEKCAQILTRQERMLILFSGDMRLTYEVDRQGEQFVLLPKEQKVLVPLLFFQQIHADEDKLLWHLYQELALYPDWQRHPETYLSREESFRYETEELAGYFLKRVKAAGLTEDPAYQPQVVCVWISSGIIDLLEDVDRWAASLIVQEKAPVYRSEEEKKRIGEMLFWEGAFLPEDESGVDTASAGPHRFFGKMLLETEFFGDMHGEDVQISTEADKTADAGASEDQLHKILWAPVMGQPRFQFLREQLLETYRRRGGIQERDALVRTFLLPEFLRLWKCDIDHMKLERTKEEQSAEQKDRQSRRKASRKPFQSRQYVRRMLQQMEDEKKEERQQAQRAQEGTDLAVFGVTAQDRQLFRHYEEKVRPQREEMKRFWRRLIGEASREVSVLVEGVPKGALDVPELIRQWPAFTEAQQKQNYRELSVFDTWELRKEIRVLPEVLDISFVIDNSGSMRSGKLQPAREALAIVLLSLQDFKRYLEASAARMHQPVKVRTETWLFGTDCRRVLSFDDMGRKAEADTILSVTRLLGDNGTTDDGKCLQQILDSLTRTEEMELQSGKRTHLIFEVTDGASSFPGAAKKAAEELQKKHVEIQAIEIGLKNDEQARNVFEYIFGEHGTFLGNDTARLPSALMDAVKRQMVTVLKGKSMVQSPGS
ncbi:vWA domain-containing protein [Porcincola intestinalis]|uniref:vWA domain-containing protein n=1 Tax=Porcincola intestinalis TaxID=2606632 RepID=UPI002A8234A1|nr:vWA domain-containing protein [Porcincola intestinalis]MDY4203874.1 vWA domain-containing protein [Porcincola intestinalis]